MNNRKLILTLCSLLIFNVVGNSLEHQVVFAVNGLENDFLQNKLSVVYHDNTAPSYEIFVNANEKYTIDQSYSWVRDLTSRYSMISYAIDDGDPIEIARKARGNFSFDISMDQPHEIVFFAVPQFSIGVKGVLDYSFTPQSPTGDSWFDQNTVLIVEAPKTIEEDGTRYQLTSWSLDHSEPVEIQKEEDGIFRTEPILVSDEHNLVFDSVTQYKVEIISKYGITNGQGWYDSGTAALLSVDYAGSFFGPILDKWEGSDIQPNGNSAKIIVNSPITVEVKWQPDYSKIILVGIIPVGVSFGLIVRYRKKKTPKRSNIITTSEPVVIDRTFQEDNYTKEITDYFSRKAFEKLNKMHEEGIVTEAKYAKIKEKLENEI